MPILRRIQHLELTFPSHQHLGANVVIRLFPKRCGKLKSGSKHLHVNRESRVVAKREKNAQWELLNTSQGFPNTSFSSLFLLNSILWPRDWDIHHRNTSGIEARLAVACHSMPYHLTRGLNLRRLSMNIMLLNKSIRFTVPFLPLPFNLSLPLSSFSSFILLFLHHLLIVLLNTHVH